MNYEYPDELDFFERGFGYSKEYNHDEGLFSFIMQYDDGARLIFTHSPFYNCSVSVKLVQDDVVVFDVYKENVSSIAFQTWGLEKVLRVYSTKGAENHDFLVYFSPKPRLRYSEF
ncbi:hypothetical protein J8M21_22265 [Pseudoalteromonas luteoviolacea]|uniref:hypothetical protein n=1 Tax=Pseudoalteromonas luteoviolacea TaxID=43657 RepID=UPI001B3A2EC0|nr:hypothetical protein [Pseudoalteromonas luteoviolacea]MBQ4879940.1 hypothetical protein [Pseudoalteromonas luteoviolacea]MBQ4908957.1 hypothetical protein [Pseudoalteromonas luteoviolacea]